jgi:phosphohistidine phosphatase
MPLHGGEMQRRLMIMRHAKSTWSSDVATDHERPLNKRGRRDAPRVGKRLAKLGWVPELVVSSDSRRTQETWELMQKRFPEARVSFTRALYAGGLTELRSEVARLSADARTVLVLGHNPGWEEAVKALSGREVRITTANVVLLKGEGATWAEALRHGPWRVAGVVRPKELRRPAVL